MKNKMKFNMNIKQYNIMILKVKNKKQNEMKFKMNLMEVFNKNHYNKMILKMKNKMKNKIQNKIQNTIQNKMKLKLNKKTIYCPHVIIHQS